MSEAEKSSELPAPAPQQQPKKTPPADKSDFPVGPPNRDSFNIPALPYLETELSDDLDTGMGRLS